MILPYRKFFVLLQSQLEINRYIQSLKGKMAEWSIATVLKTVEGKTSGGSNPSLSANQLDNQAFAKSTPNITPIKGSNVGCFVGIK